MQHAACPAHHAAPAPCRQAAAVGHGGEPPVRGGAAVPPAAAGGGPCAAGVLRLLRLLCLLCLLLHAVMHCAVLRCLAVLLPQSLQAVLGCLLPVRPPSNPATHLTTFAKFEAAHTAVVRPAVPAGGVRLSNAGSRGGGRTQAAAVRSVSMLSNRQCRGARDMRVFTDASARMLPYCSSPLLTRQSTEGETACGRVLAYLVATLNSTGVIPCFISLLQPGSPTSCARVRISSSMCSGVPIAGTLRLGPPVAVVACMLCPACISFVPVLSAGWLLSGHVQASWTSLGWT